MVENERPLLLNPLKENPEDFIEYDIDGSPIMVKAIGRNERGKRTVEHLTGINNKEVMKERRDSLESLKIAVALFKTQGNYEILERHISPEKSFAGLARFYLKQKEIL